MGNSLHDDYRVLVLAPFGKDALLVREVLERSGIPVGVVSDVAAIARCVGGGAGGAIVAEESLDEEGIELLRTPMGNLNLIERPLRPATLISSVRTAIRSRVRQYEIRDHLEEREQVEQELRRAHDELESLVEKRTLTLRKLSARLMRVQDEERRRIARELHDGLGQWLAAAQINLDMVLLREGGRSSPMLQETRRLIDHAVSSIRSMSYLLHPPLLDEAGFEAAAHWFIDGFATRTAMAIKTNFSHPDEPPAGLSKTPRMPEVVELALFRALQEGLTNAHRHSASPHVEVKFQRLPDRAVLEIQDFGRGVPPAVMDRFHRTGTGSGVGLAGICERVKELGGNFTIESTDAGTTLRSTVPLCSDADRTEARSEARDVSASKVRSHNLATNVNRAS